MASGSDLLVHGALGAAIWQLLKMAGSALMKRRSDSGADKRKVLRDEVSKASQLVHACLDAAVAYYTSECDAAKRSELARTVRHQVQLLASSNQRINVGARATGKTGIEARMLIAFRQAATLDLDSATFVEVGHDHARVASLYRTAHDLQLSLTALLYSAT